jgi:hypothetical protein
VPLYRKNRKKPIKKGILFLTILYVPNIIKKIVSAGGPDFSAGRDFLGLIF